MQYTIDRRRDLSRPGEQSELWPHALLVQSDADAALWRVRVTDGGQAVDLTGISITAQVIRPSGVTVELTGSASGSVASVVLDGNCFAEGGEITCRMIAGDGSASVTLDLIRLPVRAFSVGRILDPEERLPSLPELLAQLSRLEGAIDAALTLTDTPAYIGANGHWYVYDRETQAYVDSGVAAQGPTGVAAKSLLVNGNFACPVNQRGQDEYSGAVYTIDRWYMSNATSRLTITDSGVTLAPDGGNAYMAQYLDGGITAHGGKTYTFAVMTQDGMVHTVTGTVPAQAPTSQTVLGSTSIPSGEIRLLISADTADPIVQIKAGSDGSGVALAWAALYEGDYDAVTLPAYVPKGYAEELAECQRRFVWVKHGVAYGVVAGDGGRFIVTLPLSNPLADDKVPSVSITSAMWLYTPSGAVYATPDTYKRIATGILIEGTCDASSLTPCTVPDIDCTISLDL